METYQIVLIIIAPFLFMAVILLAIYIKKYFKRDRISPYNRNILQVAPVSNEDDGENPHIVAEQISNPRRVEVPMSNSDRQRYYVEEIAQNLRRRNPELMSEISFPTQYPIPSNTINRARQQLSAGELRRTSNPTLSTTGRIPDKVLTKQIDNVRQRVPVASPDFNTVEPGKIYLPYNDAS